MARRAAIYSKMEKYFATQAKIKALQTELASCKEEILSAMNGLDEIKSGNLVARNQVTYSRNFDTTKFKTEHPDVYESYRKDIEKHQFTVFMES